MSLLSRIRDYFQPAPAPQQEPERYAPAPFSPDDEYFDKLEGAPSASGISVTPENAAGITAFWRAVQIVGGVIASMPFEVYEVTDDSAQRRRTHPISVLLRRGPNSRLTKFDFFQTMILHLLTFGNFYGVVYRNGITGSVERIEILPPQEVKVEENSRGQLVYVTRIDNKETRYLSDRVIHISGLAWNGYSGLNIIDTFRDVFGTALANQSFMAAFYANGAAVTGIISVPQKLDDSAYKRLSRSWQEKYGGAKNAGKTAILEQGAAYQKVGFTPEEAGSGNAKKISISDIARITGVPQFLLEDLDRATFNNIEHLGQMFVTYTILPMVGNITAELSRKLLPVQEINSHEVRADMHVLLRADSEGRARLTESMMKWGIINRDEARAMEGINPIADGSGQAYYIPMNMIDPTAPIPEPVEPQNITTNEPQDEQ